MELILLQNVEKVGSKGDVVKVSDGYARNFLLPRKLAIAADSHHQKFVEAQKQRSAERKAKEKEKAQERAAQMSQIKLSFTVKAGEKGKLFGSVTAEDIVDALKKHGHEADKRQVHLKEPLRSLGSFTVPVEIHTGVKANISVEVTQQS